VDRTGRNDLPRALHHASSMAVTKFILLISEYLSIRIVSDVKQSQEAGVKRVQAHLQIFWFVENLGKFHQNLGKIYGNVCKILKIYGQTS